MTHYLHTKSRSGAAHGLSLTVCLALLSAPALAAKTDVVILKNGDHITGEVKNLARGLLKYSTDFMGTIYIEWDNIDRVVSKDNYHRVSLADGRRYFGSFAEGEARTLIVQGDDGPDELPMHEVMRLVPVKAEAKDQLDGSLGASYDFTKASDVTRISVKTDISKVTETTGTSLSLNSIVTDDGDETTQNSRLIGERQWFLRNRRFAFGLLGAEQNDELGLDIRTVVGGGLGRHYWQTTSRRFQASAGLGISYEERADDTESTDLVGLLRAGLDVFRFEDPELDLDTNVTVIPLLSNFGDFRVNYDLTFAWEMFADVDWELNFYADYDSAAPDEDSETDYGIRTGLAWEFW